MFKNTKSYPEACNYSFRDEETDPTGKENMQSLSNGAYTTPVLDKLATIERILLQQYQIQI